MKRIIVKGNSGVCLAEEEMPVLSSGQIKIKNSYSLISVGTELYYIKKCMEANVNLALGYCGSGTIIEISEGVEGFSIGDRVIAMGWGYATHSEVISVPYKLCVKIPDELSFEKAVFANLNATALHAIHRASLNSNDNVLVVGAGMVGHLIARCSRLVTGKVVVADCLSGKLSSLKQEGIEGLHLQNKNYSLSKFYNQFTKIFLCIHGDISMDLFKEYFKALNGQGNGIHRSAIIIVGRINSYVPFSVEMGNIDIKYSARCGEGYRDDAYVHGLKGLSVLSGEASVSDNLSNSIEMLSQGRLNVEGVISDIFFQDEACEVYKKLALHHNLLGVLFKYK